MWGIKVAGALALLAFGIAVYASRDNPPIGNGLRTMQADR